MAHLVQFSLGEVASLYHVYQGRKLLLLLEALRLEVYP